MNLPKEVNREALTTILKNSLANPSTLKKEALMMSLGKLMYTHSDQLKALDAKQGGENASKFDNPAFKDEMKKLMESEKPTQDLMWALKFTGSLMSEDTNFDNESDFSWALMEVVQNVIDYNEKSITADILAHYGQNKGVQEKEDKAQRLGINTNQTLLSEQTEFLSRCDVLSLSKCVFHSIVNRNEDSNAGNVMIIVDQGKYNFSSIDDGESHSNALESFVSAPFWSDVALLERPLGFSEEFPKEIEYKKEILSLDIDKEVKLFISTLVNHGESVGDYAPDLYAVRLKWVKAAVGNDVNISDIGDYAYTTYLHKTYRNLASRPGIAQEKIETEIEAEINRLALVTALTPGASPFTRFEMLAILKNNPHLPLNNLKGLIQKEMQSNPTLEYSKALEKVKIQLQSVQSKK